MQNLVRANNGQMQRIDLVDEWIKHLIREEQIQTGGLSEKSYRRILGKFFDFIQDNKIDSPNIDDVSLWVEGLKKGQRYFGTKRAEDKPVKPSTINSYLIVVRAFFRWMKDQHIYHNDIHEKKLIKNKRTKGRKTHRREWLRPEWIRGIINSIDDSTLKGARDKALILTMYYSGLRAAEVCGLNHGDIQRSGDSWSLSIKGKGRAEREDVPTTQTVVDAIGKYQAMLKSTNDSQPLFIALCWNGKGGSRITPQSVSRIFKQYIGALNLPKKYTEKLCAHSARHGLITFLHLQGMMPAIIQRLARHSSLQTTLSYLHDIDDDKAFSEYQKHMPQLDNNLGLQAAA